MGMRKFQRSFNGVYALIFLFFVVDRRGILQNPLSYKPYQKFTRNFENSTRIYLNRINSTDLESKQNPTICTGIHRHEGYDSPCDYLKANPDCDSGGFFNYLVFFYCDCRNLKPLGYVVLSIWLLALFYLLGNTAADYFCCCLEKLSDLLKLPPTVAGVTLLPLGNGAPDVFASIAAFAGRDSGDVGLNSVLGGAVFVTCIVVGIISVCVADRNIQIDKKCFFRDVSFFLVAVVSLLIILLVGEVSLAGAIAFVSIYVVYVLFVAAGEALRKRAGKLKFRNYSMKLLPISENENAPLLERIDGNDGSSDDGGVPHLPHWVWASHVAIYTDDKVDDESRIASPTWGWNDRESTDQNSCFSSRALCLLIEAPLAIPRRLTIPIVEDDRWSKPYAAASVFFAPVLLSALYSRSSQGSNDYVVAGVIGVAMGAIFCAATVKYTSADRPPRRERQLPWVLAGFVMSIVWFYMIANELISLLAAIGSILSIEPSLLALTILAWGNSTGDLMSNVAIAMNSGHGVQMAMSGCYAGPMFNVVVGLGVSMAIGAWSRGPGGYGVAGDGSLYWTLGFLVAALGWAAAVLSRNGMRPGRVLGVGLMALYGGFLVVRGSVAMADGSLDDLAG
ncbi:cation/calcium exchanger 4-like [Andrographis paniculata]|uniref:cation/calcium exchanger 4-like n=1 Tax=Andrographis paniculata TaxID=175694 RepID=UPI0021E8CB86|nr:cation/calcium exchanger 4-like [Andrographis paniculata]